MNQPRPLQLTLHITIVQCYVYAKSFNISREDETEFEKAGLGQLGSLAFMIFYEVFKLF